MKPALNTVPAFYQPYIRALGEEALDTLLVDGGRQLCEICRKLTEEQSEMTYEKGKWTLKEVMQHVIDAERVFSYRALCIARGDQTNFPGFDQNDYAASANANERAWTELIEEFEVVRDSSVRLVRSLSEKAMKTIGNCNGLSFSAKLMCYLIAGHQHHHMGIIKNRYLPII